MALAIPESIKSSNLPKTTMATEPNPTSSSTSPSTRLKPDLEIDTPTPPIPAFLQSILSAHPAPQTPIDQPNPSSALYTLPQAPPPPEDPLIPPENFSIVSSGVYRSGFPKRRNFKFMEGLRLKTVLTLVLEDYPDGNLRWCEERDVQFMASFKCLLGSADGVAIWHTW
jgi:hypothetical protein